MYYDDVYLDRSYRSAIDKVQANPFDIQKVSLDLVDERLLRFARRGNAWAVDAWVASVPKSYKSVAKNVFVDIGIDRDYEDIPYTRRVD
ncbi:hypothetical protein Xoosp13_396 [Xanthomonas phage Xoo-sp13]|nr:hypothetical protein Xoosp13_396 [Xanthomonas phage Xoo-sp13]